MPIRPVQLWTLLMLLLAQRCLAGTNSPPDATVPLPDSPVAPVPAPAPSNAPPAAVVVASAPPTPPPLSPDTMLAQIEAEIAAIPDTELRSQRFPELKDRFLTQFPQHPGRWQLRFMEAMLAAQNEEGEQQVLAESILKEIQESPDSPSALKAKSSGLTLAFDYQQFLRKRCTGKVFEEKITRHLRKFPQAENNTVYAQWLLEAAATKAGTNRLAALESFTHSSIPHVAEAARLKVDIQKRLERLRTQPVELRFTSVDGKQVDLATLRGKVVLVDFWASWCVEYLALIPGRVEAYRTLKERGFEIVGISFDEDKQALLDTAATRHMSWPQYFDGKAWGNAFATQYGIEGLPMSWLINREGLLVGTDILTGLEREVQKLLEH